MARKTVATLTNDLAVNFADNTNGDITPAVYRAFMQDLLDANAPGAAGITASVPVTVTVNTTPAKLDIYDTNLQVIGGVATPQSSLNQLTMVEGGIYRLGVRMASQFVSNNVLSIQISTNGVPSGFTSSSSGLGNNKIVTTMLAGGIIEVVPGDVIAIEAFSQTNGLSLDVFNSFFIIERVSMS
jgi:hypothetical protein